MADAEDLPDDAAAESATGTADSTGDGPTAEAAAPAPAIVHPPEELARALKAFKKRLKLTQLDSESKLGYGPMTGGRPSGIVAITPPNQYPRTVWDALVAQGKLKRGSQGQYQLVKS